MEPKAKITPNQLASYLDLKKGHGRSLKPFCDAALDVCNAFAQQTLRDSHSAQQALNLCAVWLMTTGASTPDQLKDLPLHVRYFIQEAKA